MKQLMYLAVPVMVFALVGTGCSSGKLSKVEEKTNQQQVYIKELMEIADRNASSLKKTEEQMAQVERRLSNLESRIATTQTDDSAEIQEMKETIAFLSDQLSRVDKSIQTRRTPVLPKAANVFKPGGFNVDQSYSTALEDYKAKRFEKAVGGFKEVLTVAPTSSVADNAQYWIGECYDAMGQHDLALQSFNKVFDYPQSNKHPDAQLKIGIIYAKLGRNDNAREAFQAVIDNYPDAPAAAIAAKQIQSIGR